MKLYPEAEFRTWFRPVTSILVAALAAIIATALLPRIWAPEHSLSDWKVTLLSPTVHAVDPDIVLVTLRDDLEHRSALNSLLPTDRAYLARLTDCLVQGAPSVIGFDMLFDWPNLDGSEELEQSLTHAARALHIVIGAAAPSGPDQSQPDQVNRREIARLAEATGASVGVTDLIAEQPGPVVRHALAAGRLQSEVPFSFLVAQRSGLPINLTAASEEDRFRIAWAHGPTRPSWSGQSTPFQNFSSTSIVDLCDSGRPEAVGHLVGDRIVLIGSLAQNDYHAVPFSVRDSARERRSGLEIHASILAQILRGPMIREIGALMTFLLAICAAAVGFVIDMHRRLHPYKLLLLGLGCVALFVVDALAFRMGGVMLPLPALLIALSNGVFIGPLAQSVFNVIRSPAKNRG